MSVSDKRCGFRSAFNSKFKVDRMILRKTTAILDLEKMYLTGDCQRPHLRHIWKPPAHWAITALVPYIRWLSKDSHRYSAPQSPILLTNLCPFDALSTLFMSALSWSLSRNVNTRWLSSIWSEIPRREPKIESGWERILIDTDLIDVPTSTAPTNGKSSIHLVATLAMLTLLCRSPMVRNTARRVWKRLQDPHALTIISRYFIKYITTTDTEHHIICTYFPLWRSHCDLIGIWFWLPKPLVR